MKKVQICACVANGYMLKCVAFRVTEDGANPPLTRNRDGPPLGSQSGDDSEQHIYDHLAHRVGYRCEAGLSRPALFVYPGGSAGVAI